MPTTTYSVSDTAGLNAALAAIAGGSDAYTITITASFSLTADPLPIGLASDGTLTVEGGGFTISGAGVHRGLFAFSGTTSVDDLTLASMLAHGGDGGPGGGFQPGGSTIPDLGATSGGGGAGLGAGLFVAGLNVVNGITITTGATVVLSNTLIVSNYALGGSGAVFVTSTLDPREHGGGGGLGGFGGGGGDGFLYDSGGGGGIGLAATGGGLGSGVGFP